LGGKKKRWGFHGTSVTKPKERVDRGRPEEKRAGSRRQKTMRGGPRDNVDKFRREGKGPTTGATKTREKQEQKMVSDRKGNSDEKLTAHPDTDRQKKTAQRRTSRKKRMRALSTPAEGTPH